MFIGLKEATKTKVQPGQYSQKKDNTFSDSFQKFLYLNYLKALCILLQGHWARYIESWIFFFKKVAVLDIDC